MKRIEVKARHERFVEAYAGNATEAAIAAGYGWKSARRAGSRLLKSPAIVDAIQSRNHPERTEGSEETGGTPYIASRLDRQAF